MAATYRVPQRLAQSPRRLSVFRLRLLNENRSIQIRDKANATRMKECMLSKNERSFRNGGQEQSDWHNAFALDKLGGAIIMEGSTAAAAVCGCWWVSLPYIRTHFRSIRYYAVPGEGEQNEESGI